MRPYLIDETIQYKNPYPFTEVRKNLKSIDYLLWLYQVQKVRDMKSQPDLTQNINSENKDYIKQNPHIKKEMESKVQDVLTRDDKKTGKTPIYMFYVNGTSALPPMKSQFRKICDMEAINCIEGFNMYMERKQEKLDSKLKLPNLGHWDRKGNQVVGEFLVEYFKTNSIIE